MTAAHVPGQICPAGRNDPKAPGRAGCFQAGSTGRAPAGPRCRGLGRCGAGRGGRAGPHLHPGVVLEEEEHHALIHAVEPVVHHLVEAGGQEGGEQPPGPPGQHVGGRRAQHHGGRQHAAHGVHVEHQGQQHLPDSARGGFGVSSPPGPPPRRPRPSAGGQSPGQARPCRHPLTSPGRRPHLRRPARARSGFRPQPHGPRRRRGVSGQAGRGARGPESSQWPRGKRTPRPFGARGLRSAHTP